ncbi:hypothetical protein A3K64_03530 [Candidatus Micrarchaeota archaeon RBG_16_36_9]|nr:MAG: hypothetical protein A3K64_03530 [Candidatus Micrarchaeota archaeon RBG_16_36_9]
MPTFKDVQQAYETLMKAKGITPDEADAASDMGLKLYNEEKPEQSLPYFQRAVQLREDDFNLHWLGINLVNLGRCEEALPLFEKAIQLKGNLMSLHWFGTTLARLGRYEAALSSLEKTVRILEDDTHRKDEGFNATRQSNNYWVGTSLARLGRYEAALPHLEKMIMNRNEDPSRLLDGLQEFQECVTKVYPQKAEIGPANPREDRHWRKALKYNSISGYNWFISRHSQGNLPLAAKMKRNQLEAEQQNRRINLSNAISSENGKVQFTPTEDNYNVKVSAHLLKGFSPESTDPRVQAGYHSQEALYLFVNRRIAEIYAKIFTSSGTNWDEVVVECLHGVRQVFSGSPGYVTAAKEAFGEEIAESIYSTVINRNKAARYDWKNLSNKEIQKIWSIRTDIIPGLQIRSL